MKTITVTGGKDNAQKFEAVLYSTHGPLAVTKLESDRFYVVTHIATGGKCRGFRLLKSANAAAKSWQDFDWNIAGFDDRPKLAIIYAQMKQTPEFNGD